MLVAGCASSRKSIVVTDINAIPVGEKLVFGQIKIGDKIPGSTTFRDRFIILYSEDSSLVWKHRLRKDGYFFWHLPSGKYMMIQFSEFIPAAGMVTYSGIGVEFSVPSDATTVYIGTLWLFSKQGPWIRIEDQYSAALEVLNHDFPQYKELVSKNLMRPEEYR